MQLNLWPVLYRLARTRCPLDAASLEQTYETPILGTGVPPWLVYPVEMFGRFVCTLHTNRAGIPRSSKLFQVSKDIGCRKDVTQSMIRGWRMGVDIA